jgi:hypothetical protein
VLEAVPALRLIDALDQRSTDGATIDLLRFSVDDIIALAGAENLSLDWEADDLEDEEPPEPRPASSLYATSDDTPATSNDEDEDDNPMAAALRKAGLK